MKQPGNQPRRFAVGVYSLSPKRMFIPKSKAMKWKNEMKCHV